MNSRSGLLVVCLGLAACQGSNPYVASSNPLPPRRLRRPTPLTAAPTRPRRATTGVTAAGPGSTGSCRRAAPGRIRRRSPKPSAMRSINVACARCTITARPTCLSAPTCTWKPACVRFGMTMVITVAAMAVTTATAAVTGCTTPCRSFGLIRNRSWWCGLICLTLRAVNRCGVPAPKPAIAAARVSVPMRCGRL